MQTLAFMTGLRGAGAPDVFAAWTGALLIFHMEKAAPQCGQNDGAPIVGF